MAWQRSGLRIFETVVRLRCYPMYLLVFAGIVMPGTGWSDEAIPWAYRSIAAERGIPDHVLYAVALTESGIEVPSIGGFRPWPWTLNVEGRGYFFDSRLDAWQALTKWIEDGKHTIDIGLMQVNWRYHEKRLGTPWQALDPYHNLHVGALILKECYTSEGNWWASIGCYHAPNNARRADTYRHRVLSRYRRIAWVKEIGHDTP